MGGVQNEVIRFFQFRANIADHQPLYLTVTKPPTKEMNTLCVGERKGKRRSLNEAIENPVELPHSLGLTMNLASIDETDYYDDDDE